MNLQGLNELISACKREDAEKLRKLVTWRSRLRLAVGVTLPGTPPTYREPAPEDEGEPLRRWSTARSPERYVGPVQQVLYNEINADLRRHVAPRLVPQGGIVMKPDSLLGALYVMAAEQLSGSWPTTNCASCGVWFVPRSRRDQKTCSNACRQRLSRSRGSSESS